MRTLCQISAFVWLMSIGATYAAAPAAPASQPAAPKGPRVVQLQLSAAKAPEPALKYVLLPEFMNQTPGNAVQHMYMVSQTAGELAKGLDADKFNSDLIDWLAMSPEKRPAEEIRKLLDRAATALRYAQLAAEREYAYWDIPTRSEAYRAMLPYLRPYRSLTRILALRIDVALAEGRYDDALSDLQTGLTTSRWTAGPTLIQDLVAAADASVVTQAVESWIGRQDAPNLYWGLTHLPQPLLSFRDALEFERLSVVADIPELRQIKTDVFTPEQADALVRRLVNMRKEFDLGKSDPDGRWASVETAQRHLKSSEEAARKGLLARGYPQEKVKTMPNAQAVVLEQFVEFEQWRDGLFKLFGLPFWQSFPRMVDWQKQFDAYVQSHQTKAFPFVALLPNLRSAHWATARVDRSIAALRVIEAIRMQMAQGNSGLPGSLADVQVVPLPDDPVTGKPFVYERTESGARLVLPSPDPESPQDGVVYELTARK